MAMTKKSTQVYLREDQIEVLNKKAKELDISRAELIRRIIDEKLGLTGLENL